MYHEPLLSQQKQNLLNEKTYPTDTHSQKEPKPSILKFGNFEIEISFASSLAAENKHKVFMQVPWQADENIIRKIKKVLNLENFRIEHQHKFDSLTKKEKKVLALVAEGLSTEEIATNLFISPNTVRAHRRAINKKLEIKHFKDILQFAQAFDLV
jgi:DNA-binding CsgD family transcriptional regulator